MQVSALDVVDETFLAVPPARVAQAFAQPSRWRRWWPDLVLHMHDDRGAAGLRWRVTGAVAGSMEVWLEPMLDGTMVHYFLHVQVADASDEQLTRVSRQRRHTAKAVAFELKAELEAGRAAGEAPDAEQ